MSEEADLMNFVRILEKLPERKIYVIIRKPKSELQDCENKAQKVNP